MKVVIEVVATGEEAKQLRRDLPFADENLQKAADGQTLLVQSGDGRLRPAYLQLSEVEDLPPLSIVRVQTLP